MVDLVAIGFIVVDINVVGFCKSKIDYCGATKGVGTSFGNDCGMKVFWSIWDH
jgi:hypothetical protein